MADYYEILGVPRGATQDEIRNAYRALARRFHPDRNETETASERFQAIQEANKTLSDPEMRRQYDVLGPLFHLDGRPPNADDIKNVFTSTVRNIFQRRPRSGKNIELTVQIPLRQTLGGELSLSFVRENHCRACDGTGAQTPADLITCPECQGTGKVSNRLVFTSRCNRCDGRGKLVVKRCKSCGGLGHVETTEQTTLRIPRGIQAGQVLRLAGRGHASRPDLSPTGSDKAPVFGDVLITVEFENHALFRRDGADLHCELPLRMDHALLGTELMVPTLDGQTRIRIPPRTSSHQLFRLAQHGLPTSGDSAERGSLTIRVIIEHPEGLNLEQQQTFQQWSSTLEDQQFSRCRAFQSRLHDHLSNS